MSLHYLLDGYNIIHQMPGLIPSKLEDQRLELIKFIESDRPQGSLRNKVTVVFDGQAGIYGADIHSWIEVIFAKGMSADDKIKQIVSEAKYKKKVVVVTDDRDIQYAVRALGAGILAVNGFLAKRRAKTVLKKKYSSKIKLRPKHISDKAEFEITDELKGIWLSKKKDKEKN